MEAIINEIYNCVLEGNNSEIAEKVQSALDAGIETATILNHGMVSAMSEVGKLFEDGEYYVPEMLIAARSMQTGLGILKPHMAKANIKAAGRVAIGTVKGDLHDIGKNLVAMMLEGAAFEVVDLGVDVTPEKFIRAIQEQNVQIIALSALLTTTMPAMRATIDALKTSGVRDSVKVIVGGAPLTADFAREIGADGYAPDASRAVGLAKSLLS